MKRWTILLTVLIASCGGSPHAQTVATTDEPKRDIDGYVARIAELQRDLDAGLPAGTRPDELGEPRGDLPIDPSSRCLTAADLRDRICDLSERICELAASEPESSDVHDTCTRASAACSDAKARVASACGEL